MTRATKIILALVIAFAVGTMAAGILLAQAAFDQRDEALRKSTQAASTNKVAAKAACRQVEDLDKTCIVKTSKLKDGGQSIQGVPGVQGIQGVPGNSGPQGVQGSIGPRGPQGPRGLQGIQGKQGLPGLPGENGPAGATGTPGPMGPPGKDGQDGKPGRGIKSVACNGGIPGETFVVTYDDGTTQEVPCD